jgi:hypothetical protein
VLRCDNHAIPMSNSPRIFARWVSSLPALTNVLPSEGEEDLERATRSSVRCVELPPIATSRPEWIASRSTLDQAYRPLRC